MNHFEKFESYIPFDLATWPNFLTATLAVSLIVAFRYFLMAGGFWLVFYKWQPKRLQRRQIYSTLPNTDVQFFEIKYSLYSTVIFGVTGVAMGLFWQLGWNRIYLRFDEYGYAWLPMSAILLILFHDLYFYWMHRLLHVGSLYKRFHAVHHRSLTPSPWASFSFHPVESFLEALPLPLFLFFIPMHPTVILAYLTFMTISAITNHLGFEILPRGSAEHWAGRWFISGVHHSSHHRLFQKNYGLFFTWWDKAHGTEDKNYASDFNRVLSK